MGTSVEVGELDETLRLLAEAVSGLLAVDAQAVRALRGTSEGFDRGSWRQMAANGWLSIVVPEAAGGLGLGARAACLVAERLGYTGRPEPFVAAGVMAPLLLAHAEEDGPHRARLADLLDGSTIAVVAWQNAGGSLVPADCEVRAARAGGKLRLDGVARLAPVASADAFLVVMQLEGGRAVGWVRRDTAGLTIVAEPTAEGCALGKLTFDGVEIASEDLAIGADRGDGLIARATDVAGVVAAAELVGHMERQLELTLDYLRTRKQFGQAIGSFQALQHRAVDIWMQKELARHAVTAAAAKLDDPDLAANLKTAAASGAKSRASEAALLVGKQAIQLHGAIGFTDEYELGLSFNRVLTLAAMLGNAAHHRRRFEAVGGGRPG